MRTVGQRIKQARMQMGMSQSTLAAQTRVSQPTVANWEKGSHAPRHSALEKIATALKSTPAWLIAGASEDAPFSSQIATLHHIPVLNWPTSVEAIDQSPVQGYVAATTSAERPIALKAPDGSDFAVGTTLILDRAQTRHQAGAIYLVSKDSEIILLKLDEYPSQNGSILARLVMALQEF